MKSKQAIIEKFGSASEIKIISKPIPEPKKGEVRIKIEAATVSNTDTIIRKGIYPLLRNNPPFTLGYDFVGVIDKIGDGVIEFLVGDRVADLCQIGGNANYICREAKTILRVPKDIDAREAACLLLSGITAYQIFKHFAKVKSGDEFLIHGGSGAIGNTLLQLCNINNVKAVATASTSKHQKIHSLGAIAIDYKSKNYFEELKSASANGFDVALDFTNQKSFNQSFKLLKQGGRLVTCAVLTKAQTINKKTFLNFLGFGLDFGLMMMKLAYWNKFSNKSAMFFGVVDSKKDFPERFKNDLNELFDLVKRGQLKPHIHQIISIDDVANAHQLLDDGKVQGQIVISNN